MDKLSLDQTRPTGFVCYSHKDQPWLDQLMPLFKKWMRSVDIWNDRMIVPGTKWHLEIKRKLRSAEIGIILVSPSLWTSTYAVSEELPYIFAKSAAGGMVLCPILLNGRQYVAETYPQFLSFQFAHDYARALDDYPAVEEALLDVEAMLEQAICEALRRPRRLRELAEQWRHDQIDIDRLPDSSRDCFGRTFEFELLNHSWASESSLTNVLVLYAGGGLGKSTLVDRWLQNLASKNWEGAERVFGWSFYMQGTDTDGNYDATTFLSVALRWFGDAAPNLGSPFDQGERLARIVGQKRAILILDGLEPLQCSDDGIEKGQIRDLALAAFLEGLAKHNNGLCIVTTRLKIANLPATSSYVGITQGKALVQHELADLTPAAGRQILSANMVVAADATLERMSESVGNNALAVKVLGAWLSRLPLPHGHSHEALFDSIFVASPAPGIPPVWHILADIERQFSLLPQLEILRILALVDRPMAIAELLSVVAGPPLVGLTEALSNEVKRDAPLRNSLGELQDLGLLTVDHRFAAIDTHPLVRAYFSKAVELDESRRSCHARLADHFAAVSVTHPHSIEEALPLYRSATHRSLSGDFMGAFNYYESSIQRGEEQYSHNQLAAYGNDLSFLSTFFTQKWTRLSDAIPSQLRPQILREVAVAWQTLGNWPSATEAMAASLEVAESSGDLAEQSYSASWLSELQVVRGNLREAEAYGSLAVDLGRRSGEHIAYISALSSAGDALHRAGKLTESWVLFREGVRYQEGLQLESSQLSKFVLQGYHYCSLLMSEGQFGDAEKWCRSHISRGLQGRISILTDGLNCIMLGKSILSQVGATSEARQYIDSGVSLIRESRDISFLPSALLARAQLLRAELKYEEASALLDRTVALTRQFGMPLDAIDCSIERVRLRISQGKINREKILHGLAEIEKNVISAGYFIRSRDIASLRGE